MDMDILLVGQPIIERRRIERQKAREDIKAIF